MSVVRERHASVAEWSIALGCKPSDYGLRGFESLPAHKKIKPGHEPGDYCFVGGRDLKGGAIVARSKASTTASQGREP